jgi:hypothetical protein
MSNNQSGKIAMMIESTKCEEVRLRIFVKHTQLKVAYELSQRFKRWYNISHANELRMFIERNLQNWYYAVEDQGNRIKIL